MRNVLIAWIGKTDLRAPTENETVGEGPIAQALTNRDFDEAFLLADYDDKVVRPYVKWLKGRTRSSIEVLQNKLSGPTNFGEIYQAAVRGVEHALGRGKDAHLSFHLSPGTPAMAAVWIIIHKSRVMSRLIERARRVAFRSVPVLIEGESGTGKELLARAIHRASPRRDRTFIAVNCGASPAELVESELFGHKKGSFTGASSDRRGHFKEADGGTLFLDELGELPGAAQVKLLRAIQEGEIVPLGESRPVKVDVRIVAATNRTLTDEIASGRFREDLFYRLAVAVLKLPPLRDRQGDLGMLIEHLLVQVNREAVIEPGYKEKKLSPGGKNLLLLHPWPGNVRELVNTLRRAAIWSDGASISSEDVREALLPMTTHSRADVLGRPLGGGFDLRDLLGEVARHYLERAMDEAHGNKTKATELVGLPSYQTLTNWLKTYEVQS